MPTSKIIHSQNETEETKILKTELEKQVESLSPGCSHKVD